MVRSHYKVVRSQTTEVKLVRLPVQQAEGTMAAAVRVVIRCTGTDAAPRSQGTEGALYH